MYRYLEAELAKINVPENRIRREVFGSPKDITLFPDYPKEKAGNVYRLTVRRGVHEDIIPAKANEPIAVAIERAGILFPTDCRSGACGFCRSRVISGEVYVSPENDGRRKEDKEVGYYHLCATYPLSDVTVKIAIV
ncbi:MAG: 2Fe-2S iron-sulfur cluster binding domain-containing protein [Bacilli bacterium]|nr:2Fe-2S iron-sulfur cluster binding domain-containing protein [Bacilli bacterium]